MRMGSLELSFETNVEKSELEGLLEQSCDLVTLKDRKEAADAFFRRPDQDAMLEDARPALAEEEAPSTPARELEAGSASPSSPRKKRHRESPGEQSTAKHPRTGAVLPAVQPPSAQEATDPSPRKRKERGSPGEVSSAKQHQPKGSAAIPAAVAQ